jgi:hypothetical protein
MQGHPPVHQIEKVAPRAVSSLLFLDELVGKIEAAMGEGLINPDVMGGRRAAGGEEEKLKSEEKF